MSNNILFIFEGEKTEKVIVENLSQFFINENTIITCAYCTTIYKMYNDISKDEDLDTFSLLKNIEVNKEKLKDFDRLDFAEIYMFFDYDGHASNADDTKLSTLLTFFNEETEKGKLYISYPMVEALKHARIDVGFKELKVNCKENINYKRIVSEACTEEMRHIVYYTLEIWKKLIDIHLKKMNEIVNNSFVFPKNIIDQATIFSKQLDKYISVDSTVAILSAFPVFLHDYYGTEEIRLRIT